MAKKTPFYDAHVRLGGHMVEYAGWNLPVEYSGLKEEQEAVDIMRKALNGLKTDEAAERILDLFVKTKKKEI